jgi:hypothetical protein
VGAKLQEEPKKIGKYNKVFDNDRAHPKKDCEEAIRSLESAGVEQRQGGATPAATGDKTTWLHGRA